MAEAETKFGLPRDQRPERPRNPHGRAPKRERISGTERTMARNGRHSMKANLRQAIQACEADGHRGYRLLLAMQALGWTSDVRWKNGRPIGLVWCHESGVVIPSRRLGDDFKAEAFLRRIGGIPGMQRSRPLPKRWTPPPYRARSFGTGQRRARNHAGVGASCSWWDRAMTWAWQAVQLVIAPPSSEVMRLAPPPVLAPSPKSKQEQPVFAPLRR